MFSKMEQFSLASPRQGSNQLAANKCQKDNSACYKIIPNTYHCKRVFSFDNLKSKHRLISKFCKQTGN